jgi:hypothetical protein
MAIIPATREAEVGEPKSKTSQILSKKKNTAKKDREFGSSKKALAYQVQGPGFRPQ